jgi:hypothetical protein
MTSSDLSTASHATHSARRWARALYLAAFDEQPNEVTTSSRAPIHPANFQFLAYPAVDQAPIAIAVTGLILSHDNVRHLLPFAHRFESNLKLATAILPPGHEPSRPLLDELPPPSAAATARGRAGAIVVSEHEPQRYPHHLPWLPGDRCHLTIPLPPHTGGGLLLPELPIAATLTNLDDQCDVAILLSPTREALTAKLLAAQDTPASTHAICWAGTIQSVRPPLLLELKLHETGTLPSLPFSTADWITDGNNFAIRVTTIPPQDR